jgi:hypothetical protein
MASIGLMTPGAEPPRTTRQSAYANAGQVDVFGTGRAQRGDPHRWDLTVDGRHGRSARHERQPTGAAAERQYVEQIGADGLALLPCTVPELGAVPLTSGFIDSLIPSG